MRTTSAIGLLFEAGMRKLTGKPEAPAPPEPVGPNDLWPCNDCGALTFKGDELCSRCCDEEARRQEWESMHPEHRCPTQGVMR